MVALKCEMSALGLGEERHVAKFALRDPCLEIVASDYVFHILHSVDDVLAFLFADEQSDVIPLASGLGGVNRFSGLRIGCGLIERVEPAAQLGIFSADIVLQLKFRSARPGSAAFFNDVIHDPAIASGGDIEFKREFEGVEFLGGENIPCVMGVHASQRPILDLPSGTDTGGFEIVPAVQSLAIEQEFPAGSCFFLAETVDVRVRRLAQWRQGEKGYCYNG